MSRPLVSRKMCIFDLDGTLDLTDTTLSSEILRMSNSGIIFIVATGRTNNYVRELCKKNNIIPPRFIIGDNGETIYNVRKKRYIKRITLSHDTRLSIVSEYIRSGGEIENIRYTDGENVYAVSKDEIKEYYSDDDTIKYMSEHDMIRELVKRQSDITKITLAGNRKVMKKMQEFAEDRSINCRTDIGSTKFPIRSRGNYRLDVTDSRGSKGEAVEFLTKHTGISSFTCIGNGPNDFSMFKFALDSGMPVTIVQNRENGQVTKESEELVLKVQIYATQIGMLDKVRIESYPINKTLWKIENGETAEEKRKKFVDALKSDVSSPNGQNIKSSIPRRIQHKGKEEK